MKGVWSVFYIPASNLLSAESSYVVKKFMLFK